jgi:hypothetical protein
MSYKYLICYYTVVKTTVHKMEIQKEHKKIFEKAKGSKAIVGLSVGKPIFYN